jgi:glycosyltransferase involved in cell wall biosynthesis
MKLAIVEASKPKIYIFNWPGFLGGADTKLAHLLVLLHRHADITLIPNENRHLHNKIWIKFLDNLGIKYSLLDKLPSQLSGFGLSMCNDCFFTHRIANRAKDKGLKIIWSSEMMWHHNGELEAVKTGIVDKVLYTSEFQRSVLAPGYGQIPGIIAGNYIDPAFFPFKERRNTFFTIGRLSRPAPEKYPEDFPVFYECLELPDTRFRVMAWDDKLRRKYKWHTFDNRWDLLKPEKESQADFLHSLDLFVYPLGHDFLESWGRSTVEAMLTGAIPLVPSGHQFDKLLIHGESGFICSDFLEYRHYAYELYSHCNLRRKIAENCREHAVEKLCNRAEHLKRWLEVFQ